jgi:hypothetical protein
LASIKQYLIYFLSVSFIITCGIFVFSATAVGHTKFKPTTRSDMQNSLLSDRQHYDKGTNVLLLAGSVALLLCGVLSAILDGTRFRVGISPVNTAPGKWDVVDAAMVIFCFCGCCTFWARAGLAVEDEELVERQKQLRPCCFFAPLSKFPRLLDVLQDTVGMSYLWLVSEKRRDCIAL